MQNARWFFDLETSTMKPSWELETLKVDIKNVSYDLLIEPHFDVKNIKVAKEKDMTIDGEVIVSKF